MSWQPLEDDMFKKILLKIFKHLKPEEKEAVREALESENADEEVIDTMAENEELEKGEPNMENEKIVDEQKVDKVEEKPTEEVKTEEVQAPKEETKTEETVESTETEEQPVEQPKVEEVQQDQVPNALDINDIVTKDDLKEALAALNAKFEAVVKESADKDELIEKLKGENSNMKDKYERDDFGNMSQKSFGDTTVKTKFQGFDEYSEQFK